MNEKKRKILYLITQSELGGAQKYVLDLALNLRENFEISVAFGEQGKDGGLAEMLEQNGVDFHILPHLKRAISPLDDLFAFFEITSLINKIKPDTIHLNSSKISILGSLAYFFSWQNPKLVYTVHGWVFTEPLPDWLKTFYKYAEMVTAIFKHKIICVSEFDRQTANKEKIAPEKKLITIHNGISSVIPASEPESSIKKLEQILKKQIKTNLLICSIGNLYKTKNYENFIQAAKILKDKGLDFKAIIIGEGSERKNLENLIKENELENTFLLAGNIDRAYELLTAFDIYVCSSVKEGFPYSILEAMGAGLPVVSTRVGGIPEMIKDNENGFLANPGNPEELAEKIIALSNDKILRERLGAQARSDVNEKFSLEKMIEQTQKQY